MKTSLSSLLAAYVGASAALGEVSTTPVGYTTQTLRANTLNLIGFNVLNSSIATSQVTGIDGLNISDSDMNFDSVLSSGSMYTIEITTGTSAGTVQEFNVWSGDTMTMPGAITGLQVGDTYTIRKVSTLQELFPAGSLTGSATATNADKVWIPNGSGGYTKYWYRITLPPVGWRTTTLGTNDTGAVSGPIPVPYLDGIMVEKKGVASELVLTGEVKLTETNNLVVVGLNPVSVVPPVGLTLFTSGLASQITGSATATNADKVWVPNGSGGYTKYWNRITLQPTGWRTTTLGTNDTGQVLVDVDLSGGILIERKGSNKVIKMNVPSSYTNPNPQ